MANIFSEVKKKLGFGCMRLPMKDGEVDACEFSKMIDDFLAAGFNYFDTAPVYLDGKSQTALRECLVKRYPRESFLLATKLSPSVFEKEEDVRPFFEKQLEACGVSYFDFYLLHTQHRGNYQKYCDAKAYETVFALKKEGKIRHVGFSFHDDAEFLEKILTDHPEVEFVQLQFNYLDLKSESIQSLACYKVAKKHGKPVVVMEPVRGGSLATVPADAEAKLATIASGSPASMAVRYAASYDNIFMVLSGMSNDEQIQDNVREMKDFSGFSSEQIGKFAEVCEILHNQETIGCTGCRYCVDGCPQSILIPDLFGCYNDKKTYRGFHTDHKYKKLTVDNGKASSCIECGACESVCPQHLPIRDLLKTVAKEYES